MMVIDCFKHLEANKQYSEVQSNCGGLFFIDNIYWRKDETMDIIQPQKDLREMHCSQRKLSRGTPGRKAPIVLMKPKKKKCLD